MKIIKPEDDKKAMFDAALEFMAEEQKFNYYFSKNKVAGVYRFERQ